MNVIRHVVVRGRVQGVGYRAFVEDEAVGLGLAGWVRNRRDGTVEALLSGPAVAVEAVIAACRRGPHGARVDVVAAREGRAEELAQRRSGACVRRAADGVSRARHGRSEQRLELPPQQHVDLGHRRPAGRDRRGW